MEGEGGGISHKTERAGRESSRRCEGGTTGPSNMQNAQNARVRLIGIHMRAPARRQRGHPGSGALKHEAVQQRRIQVVRQDAGEQHDIAQRGPQLLCNTHHPHRGRLRREQWAGQGGQRASWCAGCHTHTQKHRHPHTHPHPRCCCCKLGACSMHRCGCGLQ